MMQICAIGPVLGLYRTEAGEEKRRSTNGKAVVELEGRGGEGRGGEGGAA